MTTNGMRRSFLERSKSLVGQESIGGELAAPTPFVEAIGLDGFDLEATPRFSRPPTHVLASTENTIPKSSRRNGIIDWIAAWASG